MTNLHNKIVIVTGAGTGIGRATAIRFAEEGAKVILTGRRQEKLQEVLQIIEKAGGVGYVFPVDVTNAQEVHQLRDQLVDQFGRIDVVINNVGGTGAYQAIHDMTEESFDQTIRLNLYSTFIVTNAFLPIMRKHGNGRIIAITSDMARMVYQGLGAYSAAKAGLEGLMKTVALEEKDHGILVNMYDPGVVKTEQNPYGEADPATVVEGIINLASIADDGVTGQVVKANS